MADAVRAWAEQATPIRVVRAMEHDPSAWEQVWPAVVDLGIGEVVAAGGTLTDLAVLVEALAYALTPGPVLGTAVAGATLHHDPGLVALGFDVDAPVLAAGPGAPLLAPDANGT